MTVPGRRVLLTGAAGFIGLHLAERLLADGATVRGVDNLNSFYDPALKRARLVRLQGRPGFDLEVADVSDGDKVLQIVRDFGPTEIVHLAAQAGVRHSLENPRAYLSANVDGFLAILEACRHHPVRHLVYASSSSVYGANGKLPFAETDRVDRPVSLYAATKRSNELMAHTYGHLFGIPATGLRFFTVYGPWGRPDMAYYSFTQAVLAGREIPVFNDGRMSRDLTYVDDAVEAVFRILGRPPPPDDGGVPHAIFNVGSHAPVGLERLIEVIGEAAGLPVRKSYRPMQAGDVPATFADMGALTAAIGPVQRTPLEVGIGRFVAWYRRYADGPQPG